MLLFNSKACYRSENRPMLLKTLICTEIYSRIARTARCGCKFWGCDSTASCLMLLWKFFRWIKLIICAR